MLKGEAMNDAYRHAVKLAQASKDDLIRDARARLSGRKFETAKRIPEIVEKSDKGQLLVLVIYAYDVGVSPWALVDEEKLSVAARDAIRNDLGL